MRVCNWCTIEKPLESFSKAKRCQLGYSFTCKLCTSAKKRTKLANDKEYASRKREYARNYNNKARNHIKFNDKEKYEKLKAKDRARGAKYYVENREKRIAIDRAWKKRNPEARIRSEDRARPTRIINRMLKHFDAGSIGTGQLSDSVNEAVELCIAEFNKSSKRTDSK